MRITDQLPALLPEGWEQHDLPHLPHVLFHASAPDEGLFRSGYTVFAGTAQAGGETLEEVHDRGLEVAWMQMTDPLMIEHGPATVAGRDAFGTTVAYRSGPWTLTATYWTIDGPLGVVAVGAVGDADRCAVDGELFDAMTAALELGSPVEV